MIVPRPLTHRRVGIFAGSSPFPLDRYRRGLLRLASLDLTAFEDPRIFGRTGYLAGSDAERVGLIHDLLSDPSVDVLWAARGGYGLHRVVEHLDVELLARSQKAIVGFSDVCVLHGIAQRAGLVSIHGPVITQLGELDESQVMPHLRAILDARFGGLRYTTSESPITGGEAVGIVMGGCLSVLAAMVGTRLMPSYEGALVLLEDVGEATYRLDRMLTHLALAGVFNGIAGVIAGEFHECRPRNDEEPSAKDVLVDRLSRLGVPVVFGLPFGHGSRNLPIPLGVTARLDADRGELVLE
ncbi:MAG: LD-carboxypeptidase [Deltaproteobacteria bacterium]|nr:LD-carboxypeptidase [Deltaproteobacteria bacterium]